MKVEVWYAEDLRDAFLANDPGKLKYRKADETTWGNPAYPVMQESVDALLERIFRAYNLPEDPNAPVDFWDRSMSTGDVVIIDNEAAYFCASVGWRDVGDRLVPGPNNTIAFKEVQNV